MRTEDMLPACEILDKIGYYSLECWGGATFDACLRFLNEDPWERLRKLRKALPNTKLQMLFRGQNILGYKHYADDVVEEFVRLSIKNGIDNHPHLRRPQRRAQPRNGHQGHQEVRRHLRSGDELHRQPRAYRGLLRKARAADRGTWRGPPSAIKDMANLLLPYKAYSLVKRLKENVKIPHPPAHPQHLRHGRHDAAQGHRSRRGHRRYRPLPAWATALPSRPPSRWSPPLQGTEYDTGLDLSLMSQAAVHFRKVADKLKAEGFLDPLSVDINTLLYQVPGGMLSNLINQLKQANASDKFYDVLAEIPRVREDFGYPPLVTPTSQIVGTQAVMNVLSGERYKLNPKESQGLMRGEYGRLPAPVNEEVRRKVIGDAKVITHRPADDIAPELEKYRKEIGQYITQEEDVLTYALFPQVATKFFEYRQAQQLKLDNSLLDKENHVMPV